MVDCTPDLKDCSSQAGPVATARGTDTITQEDFDGVVRCGGQLSSRVRWLSYRRHSFGNVVVVKVHLWWGFIFQFRSIPSNWTKLRDVDFYGGEVSRSSQDGSAAAGDPRVRSAAI